MSPVENTKLITKQTLIPVGLAISLIAPLFFAAFWINNKLSAIDSKLAQIELRLSMNETAIDKKISEQLVVTNNRVKQMELKQWTIKDQIIWAQRLQIENDEIKIPLEFTQVNIPKKHYR